MLFNSIEFMLYFIVFVSLYYAVGSRHKMRLLLIGSYLFYMSRDVGYVVLLFASTLLNYLGGRWLGAAKKGTIYILRGTILINILLLGLFKYYLFAFDTLQRLGSQIGTQSPLPYIHIILPLGISFYTFQAIAYLVDVYTGKISAEKHLGRFALFISFFPQLVAGPIERAAHLLPQFRQHVTLNRAHIGAGLHLFIRGLFKKVVIADRLGYFVDTIYAHPEQFGSNTLRVGTLFFGFQIYCDFSGYSDMAIGLARMLGFDLMKNFKKPYLATNIADFWRQRHVSLSTWFKDYIYIPLGGNRVVQRRWYYNIFVTFVISGLWHGAAWTFVIWGGLHGLYLIIYAACRPRRERYRSDKSFLSIVFATCCTFFFVTIARVFFRANTLAQARDILTALLSFNEEGVSIFGAGKTTFGSFVFVWTMIVWLIGVEIADRYGNMKKKILQHRFTHALLLGCLVVMVMLFGVFEGQQFIYFQF